MEPKDITPFEPVKPLQTPEEALKAWQAFEDLKKKLLIPLGQPNSDYQRISYRKRDGTIEEKDFIKKSGFRKLGIPFGLSAEILEEVRVDREDGSFYWRFVLRVWAPNGRTLPGVGIADSKERGWAHVEHDVYSTAFTRALSRGISDLIAGGITSAEEMVGGSEYSEPRKIPSTSRVVTPPATGMGLMVSAELLKERFEEAGVKNMDSLSFSQDDFLIQVRKAKFLPEEDWKIIDQIIRSFNGRWIRDGDNSRWEIPREPVAQ